LPLNKVLHLTRAVMLVSPDVWLTEEAPAAGKWTWLESDSSDPKRALAPVRPQTAAEAES
jgi:hypothetical protein